MSINNIPKPPITINNKEIEDNINIDNIEEEDKENAVELLEQSLKKTADKKENEDKIVMEDYYNDSLDDYDNFDKRAWSKGKGYIAPNYPIFTNKLEGIDEGLYIFAGESNGGKTGAMMNILKDICSYRENHLYGIYISLDDSKDVIIARTIAMEQLIPISVASKPQRYQDMINDLDNENIVIYEDYLKKRQAGLDKLKEEKDLFKIVDSNKIENQTDLLNYIEKVQTFVKSKDERNNIIVGIDSIKDIQLDYRTNSDNEKSGDIAKLVKKASVDFHIPIFASCHLRKLNGNRRPILDDLKDANTLVYEASLIILTHNDVSKNKGAAKITWNDIEAEDNRGAIIEMDWAKNKLSSYKGRTFLKFQPNYSKTYECNKEDNKRYETLIYQS